MAGIVTDLPVHKSSEEEIHHLLKAMTKLLNDVLKDCDCNSLPRLITIARSTEDEYTPTNQVELIQDIVTTAMKHVYCHKQGDVCVSIQYPYLSRASKQWVYETPADICDCTYL